MSHASLVELRKRARSFVESRFVRNIAAVASGTAAAQAISLAFSPFLTRIYGPAAFGALAAFTALVNIIAPLMTLGYANAVVMSEDKKAAIGVVRLSLILLTVLAPVTVVAVYLFKHQLAAWTGLALTPNLLYLMPIALLVAALLSICNQVAIREGLFNAKARSQVASTLIMNVGKVATGLSLPTGLALIIISTFGRGLNSLILLISISRSGRYEIRRWIGTSGAKEAAATHRDFAIYRMPQTVINGASLGIPVIILTALFGSAAAGQYSVAALMLGAPIMLLGQSVGEVFFPRITQSVRLSPAAGYALIRKATLAMVAVGLIPFGVIFLWGEMLIPWIFGPQWYQAGELASWIALWMTSVLITRPAMAAMPILRMQGALLVYEIAVTAARVAALLLGARFGGVHGAVALFSLVNVAGYTALLLMVLRRASNFRAVSEH